ncbi:MAG: ABC transporter permease [Clostridiales bacterium]|nr:ABC transporter permease [Clostridiales bacterium]
MEKRHISRLLVYEALFTAALCIGAGVLLGMLFSRLMFMLLMKILTTSVTFSAAFIPMAFVITAAVFAGIFLLTLIRNIFSLHLTKPVEMLKGGEVGEREPKSNWLVALVGFVSLGTGYGLALAVENPEEAIVWFFVAVLLVMLGTYSLLTAGSIVLLKLLRKNKSFYYKTKNFTSVSGMLYRMKQNAIGLANICLLATAVLVMISSTVCLYIGVEDALRTRYPRDIQTTLYGDQSEKVDKKAQMLQIQEEVLQDYPELVPSNAQIYDYLRTYAIWDGEQLRDWEDAQLSQGTAYYMQIMPLSDYNQLEGKTETLAEDEILLYCYRGDITAERITLYGKEYKVRYLDELTAIDPGELSALAAHSFYLFVDDVYSALTPFYDEEAGILAMNTYYGVDMAGEEEQVIAYARQYADRLMDEVEEDSRVESLQNNRAEFYALYGGLFFLGIFLGLLFLMATILIIYYKQLSEGYEDEHRFEILQKVGLSRRETKQTIQRQILIVFFLPLAMAVIHICFACPIIAPRLERLNLTNQGLFLACTVVSVAVFAAVYGIVYTITARTYYKIVNKNV